MEIIIDYHPSEKKVFAAREKNLEVKFHREVLSGNMGFLNCLNDRPAIKQKYEKIWKILSSARNGFSVKNGNEKNVSKKFFKMLR